MKNNINLSAKSNMHSYVNEKKSSVKRPTIYRLRNYQAIIRQLASEMAFKCQDNTMKILIFYIFIQQTTLISFI